MSINLQDLSQYIEIACNIFTALGTVGACIISLWLSLKSGERFAFLINIPKARGVFGIGHEVEITITNKSSEAIVIMDLSICINRNNQYNLPISTKQLVSKVEPRDIYTTRINIQTFKGIILDAINKNYILKKFSLKWAVYFLKVVIITSTGKKHFFRIKPYDVRKALLTQD